MPKTTYLRRAILNHLYRSATLAKPTIWVGLHTGDPGLTGAANEVPTAGTGYARVQVTVADASWNAPATIGGGTSERITNISAVTFPAPAADWGQIGWFSYWDAQTAGNCLETGLIAFPRSVLAGNDPPFFAAGSLTIDES